MRDLIVMLFTFALCTFVGVAHAQEATTPRPEEPPLPEWSLRVGGATGVVALSPFGGFEIADVDAYYMPRDTPLILRAEATTVAMAVPTLAFSATNAVRTHVGFASRYFEGTIDIGYAQSFDSVGRHSIGPLLGLGLRFGRLDRSFVRVYGETFWFFVPGRCGFDINAYINEKSAFLFNANFSGGTFQFRGDIGVRYWVVGHGEQGSIGIVPRLGFLWASTGIFAFGANDDKDDRIEPGFAFGPYAGVDAEFRF